VRTGNIIQNYARSRARIFILALRGAIKKNTPKIMPRLFIGLLFWFGHQTTGTCVLNDASTPALVPQRSLRGNAARPPASDERRRRILQAAPAPTATPAPTSTKSTNATARPTPRPTPPPWEIRNHDRGYRTKSRSPATSFVLVLVLLIIIVCAVRFLMFGLVLFGGCCTCCCERGARKDLNRGSVVIPVTQ